MQNFHKGNGMKRLHLKTATDACSMSSKLHFLAIANSESRSLLKSRKKLAINTHTGFFNPRFISLY